MAQSLEKEQVRLKIIDLQLSLTTLEEVFLSVGALGEEDQHDERQGVQAGVAQVKTEGCFDKVCSRFPCSFVITGNSGGSGALAPRSARSYFPSSSS